MRIIFDLDGTLADNSHREHFIAGETKDWDAFFEACDGDAPMWPSLDVLHALWYAPLPPEDKHIIEIWSGRGEGEDGGVRVETLAWLRGEGMPHLGYFDTAPSGYFEPIRGEARKRIVVRMRPHGDHTPDHELKKQWLELARAQGRPPNLVFDDRQKVVDMWRAEGIPCFQVAPGQF